jgi:hypothetical protein
VLIVVLIVLGAGFYFGDQYARGYAQNLIAQRVQSTAHLAAKPSVSIEGWPFLTQVATRNVAKVDLSAQAVRSGSLDIGNLQATASGVHINSSYNGATIDSLAGTGQVPFSAVAAQSGVKGLTLAADPSGGPGEAKVTLASLAAVAPPSLVALGLVPSGPVSGVAKISLAGSAISVQTVSLGSLNLSQLGPVGDFSIKLPQLPMGMRLTGVSVTPQGLQVAVSAQNVSLSGGGSGSSGLGG